MIYHSLLQLIGHTPVLELRRMEEAYNLNCQILAKLECCNPAGSAKDRVAVNMIAAAEAGDPLGTELCRYLASTFAGALRNIALVFDPDLIVFQGDYADAGSCFDRELRSCLKNFQYFPSEGPFDIRYDQRPLEEMDAIGSYISLVQCYFNMPERYLDSSLVPETGTV